MSYLPNLSSIFGTLAAAGLVACGGLETGSAVDQDAVSTGDPVQLLSASAVQGCSSCFALTGQIRVQNLAFDKDVAIVVSVDNSGWFEMPAEYSGPLGEGYELWKVPATGIGYLDRAELAVKYVVDGQEYWDNNNGENYVIERNPNLGSGSGGTILGDGIVVLQERASYITNRFHQNVQGTIWVKNLGFDKAVEVVYTTDGWQTVKTTAARYLTGPGNNDTETWSFTIPDPQVDVEYAISYTVDGQTYWDNNFGANYFISLQ